MEQITKVFMGLMVILVIAFMGTGVVSASVDAVNAEQYAADVASYLEASNFSSEVKNKCENDAKKKGYTLNVVLSDTNNDGWNDAAEVNVLYKYSLKLLNTKGVTKTAKAYAR